MSNEKSAALLFLEQLANRPKKAPREPGLTDKPRERLVSSRWTYENVIYLKTTTHCACGAVHSQTNPYPMIRRFHPRWGVHEEALEGHATRVAGLTTKIEERNILIHSCHECLTEGEVVPAQHDLFESEVV